MIHIEIFWRRFQWVRLQLAIFYSSKHLWKNLDDVKAKLDELHSHVGIPISDEVYDQIYKMNVGEGAKTKQHVKRAFMFVLCSLKPLTVGELAQAVSIDEDGQSLLYVNRDYILAICSNLIIANEQDVVQFAFLLVSECLQSSSRFADAYSISQAHIQAAESCLTYITHYDYDLDKNSFGRYAICYWPFHCEQVPVNQRKERLGRLITNLLLNDKVSVEFIKWNNALSKIYTGVLVGGVYPSFSNIWRAKNSISSPRNPMLAAFIWGFSEIISDALEKGLASMEKSSTYCLLSGLYLASENGHETIIKLLLDKGADINAEGG